MKEDNTIEDTVAGIGRRKKVDGPAEKDSIKTGLKAPPPRPAASGAADIEKPQQSPYGPTPTVSQPPRPRESEPHMAGTGAGYGGSQTDGWGSPALRQMPSTLSAVSAWPQGSPNASYMQNPLAGGGGGGEALPPPPRSTSGVHVL